MKRIFCVLLVFALMFTLASCGGVSLHIYKAEKNDFYDGLAGELDLNGRTNFYRRDMEATITSLSTETTEIIYSEDNKLTSQETTSTKTTIKYNENDEIGSVVSTTKEINSSVQGQNMESRKSKTTYLLSGMDFVKYDDLAKTYVITEPAENDETGAYRNRVYNATAGTIQEYIEEIFGSQISYSYLSDKDIERIIEYANRFDIELNDMYRVINRLSWLGSGDRSDVFRTLNASSRSYIRDMLADMDNNSNSSSTDTSGVNEITYFIDSDVYTVENHIESNNRYDFDAEYDWTKVTDVVVQVKVKDDKISMIRTVKTVTTYEYDEYDEIVTWESEESIDLEFVDEISISTPDRSKYVDLTPRPEEEYDND